MCALMPCPTSTLIICVNQSHSSVLDKDGMAVALTSTVNMVFGSQVLDPETGIILNDEVRVKALHDWLF